MPEQPAAIKNHAAFIWQVADLLRGDYRRSEYGRVILPLTLIRRLDCVLEATKKEVLAVHLQYGDRATLLRSAAGAQFWNTSPLTMTKILDDPANEADQLLEYLAKFSGRARDVIEKFDFGIHVKRMQRAHLLHKVLAKFCELDLHPDKVSNTEMGYLYEELIRKAFELSNETAGEHFTPRELIRLMVELLFMDDDELLRKEGIVRTIYDPACGTGGMLSVAQERLHEFNPQATLEVYGQELNPETYAICGADMMNKGQELDNIAYGNSFTQDAFPDGKFSYLIANPPFGVEWRKYEETIRAEAKREFRGKFGAGLPKINDGSLLFLMHMWSKRKPADKEGSRLAIVFNGSPLFTGGASSGESEIRRWIIENDWLEAVVALPDQLFYNTGIASYFWVLTNRKSHQRRGKVQLIDAREFFVKMRKTLGEKRKEIPDGSVPEIVRLYGDFIENDKVRIFPNEQFGYLRITIERPLRLRWHVSTETLTRFDTDDKLALLLSEADRLALRGELVIAWGEESLTDRTLATKRVRECLAVIYCTEKKVEKALVDVLSIRDPQAPPVTDAKGNPEPDPQLRDYENVPLPAVPVAFEADVTHRLASIDYQTAVVDYMTAEILPYIPDAWVDHAKTKIGYEIPLTRHFYKYIPPRPLAEIDAEIRQLETEIYALVHEVTE
ncbi:MAG TPA: class I SAM-dependent DNA methyltransferase [Trebonia sp.]|jgi:type I restriction enzyme M protein|nr:class I SAM-dependent DNA methyltransferase [Trebonia sp.]